MSNPTSFAARFAALLLSLACGAMSLAPMAAHAQASAPEMPAAPAAPAPVEAAAPAAPMAAAPVSKETVDNPYSLGHTISHGDWVSRGTLLILTLMSMGSWYILVTKLYESLQLSSEAKKVSGRFFKAKTIGEAAKGLKAGSAFRFIADSGLEASEHHEGALTENIDHNSWVSMNVQRSLDDVNGRLQDGLAFLATVGSTAPFIGLFGTVWGIYNALTAIGIAGQASIDKVAGPVGEALIMTAFGLFVAVPAVLGYNWLVRRNKVTMESVRRFGADLHGVLMGARMGVAAAR
ncbi:MAG: MotA/TolQ/ExbB proton channel family protein [Caldimonas sp.]